MRCVHILFNYELNAFFENNREKTQLFAINARGMHNSIDSHVFVWLWIYFYTFISALQHNWPNDSQRNSSSTVEICMFFAPLRLFARLVKSEHALEEIIVIIGADDHTGTPQYQCSTCTFFADALFGKIRFLVDRRQMRCKISNKLSQFSHFHIILNF